MERSLMSKCMLVHEVYNQVTLSKENKADIAKSENLASVYRNTGNALYVNGDYKSAITNYNLAIVTAPKDSAEYSMGFANRSAVLYRLEKYDECMVDIERALAAGYVDSLKPKLIKRKTSCMQIIARQSKVQDEFEQARLKLTTLPKEMNKSVLCARSFVRISRTEPNRKGVFATEDFGVGELVSAENPYVYHLVEDYYLLRCQNCCARCYCMIPCETCHSAMFCDERCRESYWNSIHRYVCPFISLIFKKITNVDFVALYTVIKARTDHSSWTALWNTIENANKNKDSDLKGFVQTENGYVFDSNSYDSIHSIVAENLGNSSSMLWVMATMAGLMMHMLKKYTAFFADCPDECMPDLAIERNKYEFLVGGMILHHLMIVLSHKTTLSGMLVKEEKNVPKDKILAEQFFFGWGSYPFTNLMTNSCAPNLYVVNDKKALLLITIRPVKKGEQFHIATPGSIFTSATLEERQRILKALYKSHCNCQACANNWPTGKELNTYGPFNEITCSLKSMFCGLSIKNQFDHYITEEMVTSVLNGDKKVAIEILPRACEDMKFLNDFAPCQEFITYYATLQWSFRLLGNVQSGDDDLPVVTYPKEVIQKYQLS
ncbi:protein-lysine N-methyltransferase SMYD4-like [Arctopsyche grandis]|uniref:protein-lysine N-methyltransferase SMYD4-like n=1 Tax=Arctopsyche grandis TaxID=121162 RepID=UPI00406D7929